MLPAHSLQDLLCNLAMVAQLGPALATAGLPEELQVQVRGGVRWGPGLMRSRRALLQPAFPDSRTCYCCLGDGLDNIMHLEPPGVVLGLLA
jgi:hypothetical protein